VKTYKEGANLEKHHSKAFIGTREQNTLQGTLKSKLYQVLPSLLLKGPLYRKLLNKKTKYTINTLIITYRNI